MDEQEFLRRLADEAHDTVDMLSSHRKTERERRTCAAFLRCLGIHFSPDEIITSEDDPPDVIFREVRFEVMIVLDKGRKIHADWKKEANRRESAQTLVDLIEAYQPSVPMSIDEAVSLVVANLGQKASHYGPKTCSGLDALVYIDLSGRHLYSITEVSVTDKLRSEGWRSACFVFPPYSRILFAAAEAPECLRKFEGLTRQECSNPDVWFDL